MKGRKIFAKEIRNAIGKEDIPPGILKASGIYTCILIVDGVPNSLKIVKY
jgi:hypothetical protein